MAILLCGITMSHYAHFNLSPMGQLAVQHVFRLLALVAGLFSIWFFILFENEIVIKKIHLLQNVLSIS